jgi:hypothetical protein
MGVFKTGKFYHYEFFLDGRRLRGSAGTANKPPAIQEERRQRERLEKSYCQVIEEEARDLRGLCLGHVTDLLSQRLVVKITPTVVQRYQTDRLAAKAGSKTINAEVLLLLRLEAKERALDESRRGRMRPTRCARLKLSGGSRVRWCPNWWWFSNRHGLRPQNDPTGLVVRNSSGGSEDSGAAGPTLPPDDSVRLDESNGPKRDLRHCVC